MLVVPAKAAFMTLQTARHEAESKDQHKACSTYVVENADQFESPIELTQRKKHCCLMLKQHCLSLHKQNRKLFASRS